MFAGRLGHQVPKPFYGMALILVFKICKKNKDRHKTKYLANVNVIPQTDTEEPSDVIVLLFCWFTECFKPW